MQNNLDNCIDISVWTNVPPYSKQGYGKIRHQLVLCVILLTITIQRVILLHNHFKLSPPWMLSNRKTKAHTHWITHALQTHTLAWTLSINQSTKPKEEIECNGNESTGERARAEWGIGFQRGAEKKRWATPLSKSPPQRATIMLITSNEVNI